MKHEDFNIRYNEVMFEERDVIMNFLDEIADLRYGNQMFGYILEPMPELVGLHGGRFKVREIRRDRDALVKFIVTNISGIMEEWEASDFAYGQLSKIIDALPEPAEFSLSDIMDTHTSHNEELVEKINRAWHQRKYRDRFGCIVYAIAKVYQCECESKIDKDFAELVSLVIDANDEDAISSVLEEVCDDHDLETILSFIRYEE